MYKLFDDMLELVYVVDIENYQLLYVNNAVKKIFRINENGKHRCYEIFKRRSQPCSSCTTDNLAKAEKPSRECVNLVNGKTYTFRDSLIEWDGKHARLDIGMDITQQVNEKRELQNALNAEKMLLQCVQQLHQESDLSRGISKMLEQIGQALHAERAYIFNIFNETMSNTYEWCSPLAKSQQQILQNMKISLLDRWKISFEKEECVIIENLEDIKETSPEEYQILHSQNIRSLVTAPLMQGSHLAGFIGVDNPDIEKIQNIASLFNTLRYFLMTAIHRIQDEQTLQCLSYQDVLTGIYNRNRYLQDIEYLKTAPQSFLGVLYMDLNGLKEINDTGGHAQGDLALRTCAQKLTEAFPQADLYRIGGDEFIAIETNVEKLAFYERVSRLRSSFEKDCPYKVAIGSNWADDSRDIEGQIQAADKAMYYDKRRYYRIKKKNNAPSKFYDTGNLNKNTIWKEYHLLMDTMEVGISRHLAKDDFELIWANDCFYQLIGYEREEFQEKFQNCVSTYFANDSKEFRRLYEIAMKAFKDGEKKYEAILHVPKKDNTYIWIRLVGIFTDETVNGIPVIYVVFSDVTDIIQMKQEQETAYKGLPGFVVKIQIMDDKPRLLSGNKQFIEYFGNLEEEKPNKLLIRNFKNNWDTVKMHYEQLKRGETVTFYVDAVNTQGKEGYFQVYANCIEKIQQIPIYLMIFIDISQLKTQQLLFQEVAFIDPVTKGKNRVCFENESEAALCACTPLEYALVSMDIQKFRVINDLFGTEFGDRTLRYIYQKIKEILSEGELAARIYSDTFYLLLKWEGEAAMEHRLERLAEDINSFNESLQHKYILVMTAGIYPVEEVEHSMTQLLDRANAARKKVKGVAGKSLCICQFYSNEDRMMMHREKEIENRMQDALAQGQFVVYFQCKMNADGTQVVGAEALVRWNEPNYGLIPPDSFIPMFEKNGFIIELDLYVFEFVCKRIQIWLEKGWDPFPVSVNLSKAHLAEENFFERYELVRKKYNIPPRLLEIEITETLVFENPQLLASVIEQIHDCGYLCSMDDFGSGYSSLKVLKDIRVDILKLDKDFFTKELLENPWEIAIVGVVVELAKRLHIKTVAEGVETPLQVEFLKKAGCDMLQGFLFSKPVPVEDFERLAYPNRQVEEEKNTKRIDSISSVKE